MPVSSSDCPERFSRTVDLYGEAGFAAIRAASVVVCGLGGVGAHAALALARSGIGRLVLIDFDPVTASSLNRSPCATSADVGARIRRRLGSRAPADTAVDEVEAFFTPTPPTRFSRRRRRAWSTPSTRSTPKSSCWRRASRAASRWSAAWAPPAAPTCRS
jgi:tRNA A37 threonylcarbamoyladenosine dehydratase